MALFTLIVRLSDSLPLVESLEDEVVAAESGAGKGETPPMDLLKKEVCKLQSLSLLLLLLPVRLSAYRLACLPAFLLFILSGCLQVGRFACLSDSVTT